MAYTRESPGIGRLVAIGTVVLGLVLGVAWAVATSTLHGLQSAP